METISNFETNTLYYGDCLEIMKDWEKEQVDLIYLDPPFNSNADYNVLFKPGAGKKKERFAQKLAFVDTWNWNAPAVERVDRIVRSSKHPACRLIEGMKLIIGETGMLSYISYMADRLEQCHRVLKKTGSIYLHCDDTASHYLKLLMDAIFGARISVTKSSGKGYHLRKKVANIVIRIGGEIRIPFSIMPSLLVRCLIQ